MNDVNRLRILQDVIDRRLTTRLAASRLEISDRHCRRLLERYREHGPLSFVNRRRGQPVFNGHSPEEISDSVDSGTISTGKSDVILPA